MKKRFLSVVLCLCVVVGMVPAVTTTAYAASSIADLKQQFPHGSYWNHYVAQPGQDHDSLSTWDSTYMNTVTNAACAHHGDGYTGNYVGMNDCNRFDGASQCIGFARRLAWGYYGSYVSRWSSDQNISNLKAGDVVQYDPAHLGGYGHTIWVTSVNGNDVTYADCNGLVKCQIRWDQSTTKSEIGKTLKAVYHAPYAVTGGGSSTPSQPTAPAQYIGQDFHAYIYNDCSRCHLENRNDNIQTASQSQYDPRQIWYFAFDESRRAYKIINEYDGRCLDAERAGWENDTNIIPFVSNDGDGQRWWICGPSQSIGWNNNFYFVPYYAKSHQIVIDIERGDNPRPAGTNVALWNNHYRNNGGQFVNPQTFEIHQVSSYRKPAKPSAPTIKSISATPEQTIVSWNSVPTTGNFDSREYEISIYNRDTGNYVVSGRRVTGTSYTLTLSAGNYRAEVKAVNTKYENYTSGQSAKDFAVAGTPSSYTVNVSASPTAGGTVNGGGSYANGKSATVKAVANSGYTFKGWMENGSIVSGNASYTFTVSASRTLTAVFEKAGAVAPTVTAWPTAAAVNYGQTLASSTLSGGKASVSGTFQWADPSVRPQVGQSYSVVFSPLDTTKYSTVSGKVSVTVNKAIPALSLSASQSGTSVTVNISASNPYNATLTDVPTPTVTYRIGNGTEQKVTGSSFTIPEGTASGVVITITASAAENANYRAAEKSTTLTVSGTTSGTSYHILATSGSDLGGSVSIQPASARQGETVTVIATPRSGYRLETVTATDASGAAVRLTSLSGGRYTFTMPNGNVTLDAVFEVTKDEWINPFSDIAEGAWYYDAVKFVSQNGLMNGSDGIFNHSGNLSRAMIAQILYNKEGRPTTAGGQTFSDVAGSAWYANAISWAANKKLIFGDEKGLFSPNNPITREQLALILWRYEGSPTSSGGALNFTDAGRISSYAREAVSWAVANGIISGKGGGVLDPQGPATRAQVAQMLKNYLEP